MGLSRRAVLRIGVSAAGGLAVGVTLPAAAQPRPHEARVGPSAELSAWVVVDPDDSITVRVARADTGQGTITSLPMIVAGAVIGTLSAIDIDSHDTHSFSVSDARFEVVAGQLKLVDGVSLDFEAVSVRH